MNRITLFLTVLLSLAFSCAKSGPSGTELSLLQLLHEDRLFELREAYRIHSGDLPETTDLMIQATLLNTFNRNEESNQAIERLLGKYENELNDSTVVSLLNIKADNYLKLFNYQACVSISKRLMEAFRNQLDSTEYADVVNMRNIYEPLINIPPQKVTVLQDLEIPLSRDKAGLMNIKVNLNSGTHNLIFDTGAGMSIVKRSFVELSGMTLLETSVDVNAATGNIVKSALAVADSLYLDDILVTNVVFLVLGDEALEFPQIDYFPLGAIGFPVIEELKEIAITNSDTLIVKVETSDGTDSNMRLNGLQPLVYLYNGADTLQYAFDTGATHTHLTSDYYHRYRELIHNTGTPDTIWTGGAGGRVRHPSFRLDLVNLYIGEEVATLEEIQVHKESNQTFQHLYGNIGQDLIRQFDRFTLNFDQMYFKIN